MIRLFFFSKALGSAYFIRQNIPIQQWNFTSNEEFISILLLLLFLLASSFHNVVNRQISVGNLINAQTLRKEKFPREFFPEVKTNSLIEIKIRYLFHFFLRLNGLEKVLLKHVGQ